VRKGRSGNPVSRDPATGREPPHTRKRTMKKDEKRSEYTFFLTKYLVFGIRETKNTHGYAMPFYRIFNACLISSSTDKAELSAPITLFNAFSATIFGKPRIINPDNASSRFVLCSGPNF